MTEEQIDLMIFLSEKSNPFSVGQFMHSFIVHFCGFFITYPITTLIMYVIEGGDLHLAYNMQFYGCHGGPILTGLSFLAIPIYSVLTIIWHNDSKNDPNIQKPNYMIFVNICVIIMCRCVVASVKYGYFSEVRMQIYRTNYMSLDHLGSNLAVVRLTTLDVKWKLKLLM